MSQKLGEIKQVGIVVRDIEKAMKVYENVFGIGPFQIFELDSEKLKNVQIHDMTGPLRVKLAFAKSGDLEIELIQILEGKTVFTDFLSKYGEGIHHLGFLVQDLDLELERMKASGIKVIQKGISRGKNKYAYLDSEKTCGVIYELIQRG